MVAVKVVAQIDKVGGSRPLRADARRNRELVLATARDMLAAEGLSVSFDDIAKHAGVGVGTVYRHFPTKEALFEAVILDRIDQFTAKAREVEDSDAPGEAFTWFFAHVVNQVSLNQALCEAMEENTGSGFVPPETVKDDFLHVFVRLLDRAQEVGAIRPDVDITDVRALMVGCAVAERGVRARGRSDRLIAIVCDGLRGRN